MCGHRGKVVVIDWVSTRTGYQLNFFVILLIFVFVLSFFMRLSMLLGWYSLQRFSLPSGPWAVRSVECFVFLVPVYKMGSLSSAVFRIWIRINKSHLDSDPHVTALIPELEVKTELEEQRQGYSRKENILLSFLKFSRFVKSISNKYPYPGFPEPPFLAGAGAVFLVLLQLWLLLLLLLLCTPTLM